MNELYKDIGLRRGELRLVQTDAAKWKHIFDHEKAFILTELNKPLIDEKNGDDKFEEGKDLKIIHYGSTAFDKIKAKPILDILIGFGDKASLQKAKNRILGNNKGIIKIVMTPRLYGFYLLGKMDGDRSVAHYNLSIIGSRPWNEQINFHYMLRKNWKILKEYEQLKEGLFAKHKNSRVNYSRAKGDFFQAVVFRKWLLDQRKLLNIYSKL